MEEDGRLARRRDVRSRRRRRRIAGIGVAALAFAAAGAALATALSEGEGSRAWAGAKAAPRAAPPAGVRLRPSTQPVPILMYHVVEKAPVGARYPELYVDAADFAGQMAWLAKRGYEAVTLTRVADAWRGRAKLPKRPVVITFDDGYRSVYTVALPTLRRHRWVGVLNLAVSHQWTDLPPRLIWKLRAAGWELADHTFTHPELPALDDESLEREVAESRRFLQKQYRVPVNFFCYPAGHYDDRVVAAVRAAGYRGATTVNYGVARPSQGMFTLSRVRVNGSDGVGGFAARMAALGR